MAKKGQAIALQQELTTDEEWDKYLQKPGLLVIDVFCEWSGPCSAMIPLLKKIKMEIGGDNIQYAIAKADTISYLERFRMKCEPTWMFISGGKMVNLTYGADAPRLTRILINELKLEEAARAGQRPREGWDISEMGDEERVRYEVVKAVEDERIRIETEKRIAAIHERRLEVSQHVIEMVPKIGIILVFPQAIPNAAAVLGELWEPNNLVPSQVEKPKLTEEILEELLYFTDFRFAEYDLKDLLEKQCLIYGIKPYDADAFVKDMDDFMLEFVYGESKCPPGSEDSPAQRLIGRVVVEKEEEGAEGATSADALGVTPSMPSLSAIQMSSEIRHSQELQSQTGIDKSKSRELGSKEQVEMGEQSKEQVTSETGIGEEAMEDEGETVEVSGLWVPPNPRTRALTIKLLFPRIYDPIALPEPIPTPPHIAIAFDALRRREVLGLMDDYETEVMRFGFFTTDNPNTAKLVAKTVAKYERHKVSTFSTGEKLVIQLSRKRSEAWCVLAQLNPTFMSHTAEEGEVDCKKFFPEGYDDLVEEEFVRREGGEEEEEEEEVEEEGSEENEGDEGDDEDLMARLGVGAD